MLASRVFQKASSAALRRSFSSAAAANGHNVAVLGAAGGIGQPLSLLLKTQSGQKINSLRLYDVVGSPGVAADVSHVDTHGEVKGYLGDDQIKDTLTGCDVVVIPAGVPRKPGMTRDDLFNTNASIVQKLIRACGQHCPEALIAIISNPVNSTVPIAAETLRQQGVYDKNRLFGVTTLDVVRANRFISESVNTSPEALSASTPVVGGHAGHTIVPLISQVKEASSLSSEQIEALTHRIQFGGDEVVQAKEGTGSATLSMAYAGARFTGSLLRALDGDTTCTECAFVESNIGYTDFFASRVDFGRKGVEKIHPLGDISAYEKDMIESKAVPELQKSIERGTSFAKENKN
eukprot:gb/GECG01012204.1/.p1 GENE.gb/GECG01012204.1/~~gb/GECG01012204.1/.p1  ORF type:complete len:348 (+),score=45.60 gb/GECG01012204.1/:1-1044(+)